MPALDKLALFAAASITMLIVPGPAVAFIVATAVARGRLSGLAAALGMVAGGTVHLLAAVLGMTAVLIAWPGAFRAIVWAGAAYLVWLGARLLRSPAPRTAAPEPARRAHRGVFLGAVLVSVTNPKAVLFFLAFLPQFIDPQRGPASTQALALGGSFLCLALVTDSAYALVAGSLSERLGDRPGLIAWGRRAAAAVYFVLAAAAVLSGVPS